MAVEMWRVRQPAEQRDEVVKAAGRQGSTGCAGLLEAEGSGGWMGAVNVVEAGAGQGFMSAMTVRPYV